MRMCSASIALTLLPLLACGGGTAVAVDAPAGGPDSGSGSGSGSGSAGCTASASYTGTLTLQSVHSTGSGRDQNILYLGDLDADAAPDRLDIELYAGNDAPGGVFDPDIATKSVSLTGVNGSDDACAACVQLWTNTTTNAGGTVLPAEQYQATAGTLDLTSVSGTLTATLTGATFTHVIYAASGAQLPAPDGCTSTIASASISAPLGSGSGSAFAPTASNPRPVQMLRHRSRAH